MMTIETTHQNICASSAELGVTINYVRVELVISGRQLYAKVHTGREIGRKAGVKAFNPHGTQIDSTAR